MNNLVIAALIVLTLWLSVLTLVTILSVRQIALLTLRISATGRAIPQVEDDFSVTNDGPDLGSPVPDDVVSTLPELREERAYILLLSSSCVPCRELAIELTCVLRLRACLGWPPWL